MIVLIEDVKFLIYLRRLFASHLLEGVVSSFILGGRIESLEVKFEITFTLLLAEVFRISIFCQFSIDLKPDI